MSEYALKLEPPVDGAHEAELRRRVYFVSERITGFELVHAGADVVAVHVVTDLPVDAEQLGAKLAFVVDHEVRPQLRTPPKVLWRSPSRRRPRPDTFAGLAADGVVHEISAGQVALGGPAIAAMDALDGLLMEIIVGELGAQEYRYPTLLPVDALERSGYLSSFPQHMMFAARLDGDVETYREFAADVRAGRPVGNRTLNRCGPVDRCLPPTMCYHTFDQFAGTVLPQETAVVTARGGSFRHEARYHRTLERLSDFTIRETVFLGPGPFVRECRDRFRTLAIELAERLDLAGRCEVASDPFFAAADGADRASAQRLLEIKHELHLDIGSADSIAVGSFNLHERHFSEVFDIRGPDGELVHSACVGFGLERLTYAFLCQYGWDPGDWPDPLRRHLRRPLTLHGGAR